MKTYKIVYCFTNIRGIIESDENGEIIYTTIVEAKNGHDAIKELFKKEHFVSIPDILEIKEVQI